jgi:hypothetical protein
VPQLAGPNWTELVARIRTDDQSGIEERYRVFATGLRFYLCRQLGPQDLDDKVRNTFLIVMHAVGRGELRESERLIGLVRTVLRRQVVAHIDQSPHNPWQQVGIGSSNGRGLELRPRGHRYPPAAGRDRADGSERLFETRPGDPEALLSAGAIAAADLR